MRPLCTPPWGGPRQACAEGTPPWGGPRQACAKPLGRDGARTVVGHGHEQVRQALLSPDERQRLGAGVVPHAVVPPGIPGARLAEQLQAGLLERVGVRDGVVRGRLRTCSFMSSVDTRESAIGAWRSMAFAAAARAASTARTVRTRSASRASTGAAMSLMPTLRSMTSRPASSADRLALSSAMKWPGAGTRDEWNFRGEDELTGALGGGAAAPSDGGMMDPLTMAPPPPPAALSPTAADGPSSCCCSLSHSPEG